MTNGDGRRKGPRTIVVVLSGIIVLLLGVIAGGLYYVDTYVWKPIPSTRASSPYDDSDRRNVVAVADVVFLGEVEETVSEVGLPLTGPGNAEIPMTQYRVHVVQTLKGDDLLEPTVIVNVVQGPFEQSADMGTGGRYIFAASSNKMYDNEGNPLGHGWFRVSSPGRDYVRASTNAEEAALLAAFTSAIANQPPREEVLGTERTS